MIMADDVSVSEIRELRKRLGLTQEEFAERLGLRHKSSVCRLEGGRDRIAGPKLVVLEALRAEAERRRTELAGTK